MLSFRALHNTARLDVPDPHALVETTGSDVAIVGRYGDSSDTVVNGETQDALVFLNVPESDRAVTRARSDVSTVGSKVQRVDVLIVPGKAVPDAMLRDIPDLQTLVTMQSSA